MPKNLNLALALVRDAALARRNADVSTDSTVGRILRSLGSLPADDEVDPDQILESFTSIATAAVLAISALVGDDNSEVPS